MRLVRSILVLLIAVGVFFTLATAQNPPAGQRGGNPPAATGQRGERGATPDAARGGRGGRGGGGGIQTMTLVTTAWPDGGYIPLRYTQAGAEVSPAIQWSNVPSGTASFVLMFRDLDVLMQNTPEPLVHWMVWNIAGTATQLPQGRPDGLELEDGMRQMSVSGFRYRGPGASANGPVHHYVLEIYALSKMLDIKVDPPNPQGPNPNVGAIRDAIFQAMRPAQGEPAVLRGKGAYVGLFRRPQ